MCQHLCNARCAACPYCCLRPWCSPWAASGVKERHYLASLGRPPFSLMFNYAMQSNVTRKRLSRRMPCLCSCSSCAHTGLHSTSAKNDRQQQFQQRAWQVLRKPELRSTAHLNFDRHNVHTNLDDSGCRRAVSRGALLRRSSGFVCPSNSRPPQPPRNGDYGRDSSPCTQADELKQARDWCLCY